MFARVFLNRCVIWAVFAEISRLLFLWSCTRQERKGCAVKPHAFTACAVTFAVECEVFPIFSKERAVNRHISDTAQ